MSAQPRASSVQCNHCGGPLQVPDSARFVTCSFCGSQLELHRSGNAVYTQVLEAIERRTRDMAQDLGAIRQQNELERLDREWQMRRETLLPDPRDAAPTRPSALHVVGAVIAAVIAAAFGVFWISQAQALGAPSFMTWFGAVFVLAAVWGGVRAVVHSARFARAELGYLARRRRLLGQDGPPGA